jgi:colicin import membrane protein
VSAEPVKPLVETPPVPNFTRSIKRTIQKEKAKTDKEIKKQREADARAAKERELADKRLSYAEYQKSLGNKQSPAQKSAAGGGASAPGPRIDASGIKKGVTGGTGAGSKGAGGTALSAAEGAAMERYESMLIQRLKEAHEKPGGLSDLLTADVRFTMAANGSFSSVRIVRSSGNADFDQSVIEAFARVRMPARPDGKTEVIELTFRMKEL